MNDIIYIRILQHEQGDDIRIGMAYPIVNTESSIDAEVERVKGMYEQRSEWCGGFAVACEKYWRRVALINADTLETIRDIYKQG